MAYFARLIVDQQRNGQRIAGSHSAAWHNGFQFQRAFREQTLFGNLDVAQTTQLLSNAERRLHDQTYRNLFALFALFIVRQLRSGARLAAGSSGRRIYTATIELNGNTKHLALPNTRTTRRRRRFRRRFVFAHTRRAVPLLSTVTQRHFGARTATLSTQLTTTKNQANNGFPVANVFSGGVGCLRALGDER